MQFFLFLVCLVLTSSVSGFMTQTKAAGTRKYLKMAQTDSMPESYSSSVGKGIREAAPMFTAAAATLLLQPLRSLAEDAPAAAPAKPADAPAKVELGPVPTDFGLNYKDYYADVGKVVNHMRYAVQMEKSNPRLAEVAGNVKAEMLDFVSYYRRFNGIAGKQSFSLLYTSVNVLAGHYTSYGTKFPVPEKRRKRLLIEFNDIEKQVRKKR